jgi:two-component system, NtrC family, response regulator
MTKASTDSSLGRSAQILLVEDDGGLCRQMQWALEPYQTIPAGTATEALRKFESGIHVVILDLGLPPDRDGASEGLKVLNAILNQAPETKVIILSGNSDRAVALSAVERGAFDFISKPVEIDALKLIVQRAMRMYELEKENRALRLSRDQRLPGIVYASLAMGSIARTIERVARTDAGVLILGESGTGKELVASALHQTSARREARLVAINCASIPENLLESELFGHERGAFTGAIKQTIGKFELADKGTLFLDEIGDMPLALQAKVLRFLQSRKFERVGGRQTLSVDVRVISATNQPLGTLVKEGKFREDLYYRLNEILIEIPPLRDREGDVVILAQHFLNIYNNEMSRSLRGFTEDALAALGAYEWPGNVRELEHRVKRAVIMADGPLIAPQDLELAPGAKPRNLNLRDRVQQLEDTLLKEALAAGEGNVSKAAKLMGISRQQIYNILTARKQRA